MNRARLHSAAGRVLVFRLVLATLVLTFAAVAVLIAEALWARGREYLPASSAPPVAGTFGPAGRPELRLVILGDSTAAGVGAGSTATTVGGRLATALGERGRRVELASVAVSGAHTADLADQVGRALATRPQLAVITVGANDVTHRTGTGRVERDLRAAVGQLTAAGVRVVVGTCPDMGGARALPRPLRDVAAWRGRVVATAQDRATRAAGGVPVDLGRLTGPAFRADPATLSADRFHPSDRGYGLWADALAPAVQEAAGTAGP